MTPTEDRNWIVEQAVNLLIRQLFAYIRRIINEGSAIFGIPPLDPIALDHFHLQVPAGLINLDLELKNILGVGIGSFEVHRSYLDLADLSFDIDISVPTFDISAEHYDLVGDFFTAIPLYGKGRALFKVEGFRFQAKIFLEQSEDEKSVIINRIENTAFQIPGFKSDLTGAIGGGEIDRVVNAMIEEVIMDYVNRFRGFIAFTVGTHLPAVLNPFLNELDTWRYIAALPRPRDTVA